MAVDYIPLFNEGQNLIAEVLLRGEVAMLQAPTVQDGEENLNLVHPGSMQRGVNKGELSSVPLIEIGPSPIRAVMVDVQVIPNDDDALVVPVLLGDVLHQLEQVICRTGPTVSI